jgi:hypothetical protein
VRDCDVVVKFGFKGRHPGLINSQHIRMCLATPCSRSRAGQGQELSPVLGLGATAGHVEGSGISEPEAAVNAVSFPHNYPSAVSFSAFVFSPSRTPTSLLYFLLLVCSVSVSSYIVLLFPIEPNSKRACIIEYLARVDFPSTSSIFQRPSNNSSILQPPLTGTLPQNHKSLSNFNPLTAAFITLMAQPRHFCMVAIAKVKTTAQRGGRWLKRSLNACRGSQASTNTRNLSIVGQT